MEREREIPDVFDVFAIGKSPPYYMLLSIGKDQVEKLDMIYCINF